MAINSSKTTRIKVALSWEVKQALEQIAESHGISLSKLVAEAAIERHLLGRFGETDNRVRKLERQLASITEQLEQLKVAENVAEPAVAPKRRKSMHEFKLGILGAIDAAPVIELGEPVAAMQHLEALELGKPLHIDNLVIRFGGDRSLKARLCQLGGRDGSLFAGDMARARKVELITSGLDPEGLSWMPTGADRVWWKQLGALAYVKEILGMGEGV